MNKYNKTYFENYAFNSLIKCYDKKLNVMIKSESPDYQSQELNIGIEISRAINRNYGEYEAITNEILDMNLPLDEKISQFLKKDKKNKYDIFAINNCLVTSNTKGLYNFQIHIDSIKDCIKNKTKKLNTIYKIFKENWLYIFAESSCMNENDINEISKFCEIELSYNIHFNKIFINCLDRIFVINNHIDKYDIEILTLSSEELVYLKKISLKCTN